MKFIRDTMITFSAQIASVLLAMVSGIVVARVLGPSGKGVYALIILVPTLLALLAELGIGVASLYFGSKKRFDWPDLVSNSLVSALTLGLLASSAFLVCFFVLRPSFLSDVEPLHLVLATTMVAFIILTACLGYILLGQGRIGLYNLLKVAPPSICLALTIVLLLAFGAGVLGAVVAWVGGVLMGGVLSVLLVSRVTRIRCSFRPRVFKASVGYGIQAYLSNVIQYLNYRVDTVMVAYFLDTTAVGYYSVAVVLAEALWYFPGAVGTMVAARTPGLSEEEANKTTPRICRTTLAITLLAALAIFALSRYFIVLLFGSDFLPAVKPLWYLLPGIVALSICKVLSNELAGRGKPMVNAVVGGISLAVNIPLNLLLIPRMGISGAALASSVSYSVSALVTLIVFMRVSGQGWFDTLIVKSEDLRLYASLSGTLVKRIWAVAGGSRE